MFIRCQRILSGVRRMDLNIISIRNISLTLRFLPVYIFIRLADFSCRMKNKELTSV